MGKTQVDPQLHGPAIYLAEDSGARYRQQFRFYRLLGQFGKSQVDIAPERIVDHPCLLLHAGVPDQYHVAQHKLAVFVGHRQAVIIQLTHLPVGIPVIKLGSAGARGIHPAEGIESSAIDRFLHFKIIGVLFRTGTPAKLNNIVVQLTGETQQRDGQRSSGYAGSKAREPVGEVISQRIARSVSTHRWRHDRYGACRTGCRRRHLAYLPGHFDQLDIAERLRRGRFPTRFFRGGIIQGYLVRTGCIIVRRDYMEGFVHQVIGRVVVPELGARCASPVYHYLCTAIIKGRQVGYPGQDIAVGIVKIYVLIRAEIGGLAGI